MSPQQKLDDTHREPPKSNLDFETILLLVGPPRCCTTAVARLLWQLEEISHYRNEPFEAVYKEGLKPIRILDAIGAPLAISARSPTGSTRRGLLIKDLSFQLGAYFTELVREVTPPVIFLMRDPRFSIPSRHLARARAGLPPSYAWHEDGWDDLEKQVAICEELDIPHILVEATILRNHLEVVLLELLDKLKMNWSQALLTWGDARHMPVDNYGGTLSTFYEKALTSRSLLPDFSPPPSWHEFPEEGGQREHVERCLSAYHRLLGSQHLLSSCRKLLAGNSASRGIQLGKGQNIGEEEAWTPHVVKPQPAGSHENDLPTISEHRCIVFESSSEVPALFDLAWWSELKERLLAVSVERQLKGDIAEHQMDVGLVINPHVIPHIPNEAARRVVDHLEDLTITRVFHAIEGSKAPLHLRRVQFNRMRAGDYNQPHRDSDDVPDYSLAVVLFLTAPEQYRGGELFFQGALGPVKPGLYSAVAFHPDLVHGLSQVFQCEETRDSFVILYSRGE